MVDALGHLGNVSRRYQTAAADYKDLATAAAEAKATHTAARARRILQALDDGEASSHAKAETIAEADDEVAQLYQRRLITAAIAESAQEQLRQLREQVQNGRTVAATEREIDKIHAEQR